MRLKWVVTVVVLTVKYNKVVTYKGTKAISLAC